MRATEARQERRADDQGEAASTCSAGARAAWKREATIRLPKDVDFIDYASVAVRGDRIAVVSQSSSALWIGTLATTGFAVEEGGTIYEFPRDADHRVVYGTVEGVSWLTDDRLVMVSDRAEGNTPARAKEQSLHVFRLPSST